MEQLITLCLERFDGSDTPLSLAEAMMDQQDVLMHCPAHHFIVPAALLTVALRNAGHSAADLEHALRQAADRAKKIPGGVCGFWGCCGAAAGAGIFAALFLGADPKKEQGWAPANWFTAKCLERVASVDGPRCCKRVTYLTLEAAHQFGPALPGVHLGTFVRPVCHRYLQNTECKGTDCPFFPSDHS